MDTESRERQPWWTTHRASWLGSAAALLAAGVLLAIAGSTTIAVVFVVVALLFAVYGLQDRDLMGRKPDQHRSSSP